MSEVTEFMTKLNFKIGKQKESIIKLMVMNLYSPNGLELKYISINNYYVYKDTLTKVMIIKLIIRPGH